MRRLELDWADQIWAAAKALNDGKGAAWLLPLAALAVTGVRPASLERGIEFAAVTEGDSVYLEARIKGAKIIKGEDGTVQRGQEHVVMRWRRDPPRPDVSHRARELEHIMNAVRAARPHYRITVQYDAEAISTRLRELSRQLWPRKTHHVSGVCYRELLSATAKAAGVPATELAAAMGHLSAESQGRYAGPPRRRKGGVKPARRPFGEAVASSPVRTDRSPMARFKRSSVLKKIKPGKP